MKKGLTVILILVWWSSDAQESDRKLIRMEGQLMVDNDVFTFNIAKDQYYSSGIFGEWRYLRDSSTNAKRIRSFKLNQRMYTPMWIGWDRLDQLDRPYAGTLSASISDYYYFRNGRFLRAELEVGWLGPGSLVGASQETWHGWFGLPEPKGWQYQINDSPLLNLYLHHAKAFAANENLELASETQLAFGTVYNYIHHNIVLRIGNLKPLTHSAYTSSSVGNYVRTHPVKELQEFYFFYSPGLEYVFYNATIEGNLMGSESIYTEDAVTWIWQHRAGVMLSWQRFDLSYDLYWRRKENASAQNHSYARIRLNQRF